MSKEKYGFEENPIQKIIRKIKWKLYFFYLNKVSWELRKYQWSFIHHLKCYAKFWKLPNVIHGTERLLYAEKESHEDTKTALDTAECRLENLIEQCVDKLPADSTGEKACPKAVKEFYEGLDMQVPEEYLTEDEAWDRTEKAHEDYLGTGGIPDDIEIVEARREGRELLGIKSEIVYIDKLPDGEPLPKHLVYWKEKITTEKGGWNVCR